MPELNVLPVNVSKNIESKDESVSFDSTTSKDDFSKYINLHLSKNSRDERNGNLDSIKSETKFSKKVSPSIDAEFSSAKPGDLPASHNSQDKKNSVVVQEVATSGNKDEIKLNKIDQKLPLESEKLISFLSKAENTLINQPIDTSISLSLKEELLVEELSIEQRIIEQNAHYETQLLLNGSNLVADLSSVAKALGNDQADTVLLPIMTDKSDSTEEKLLNDVVEEMNTKSSKEDKKGTHTSLSGELFIEGKNKEGTNIQAESPIVIENKTIMTEPKTEINSESKASNILSDKTNTVLAELETAAKINTESKVSNIISDKKNTVLVELENEAKINNIIGDKANALLAETKTDTKIYSESKVKNIVGDKTNSVLAELEIDSKIDTKIAQEALDKTLSVEVLINRDVVSKDKEDASSIAEKKVVNNRDKVSIAMNNEKINQNSLLKEVTQQHEIEALNRSQLTQANSKNQVLSDGVKSLEKTSDIKSNGSKKVQTGNMSISLDSQITENELIQNSEVLESPEKVNQVTFLNKNTVSTNQSITNDLIKDDVSNTQVKENEKAKLSVVLDEKIEQESSTDQNKNTASVETKVTVNSKKESPVTSHFIDVSGKATQVTQDIIEQQSIERVNPSSTTEVTNNQKFNAQLHQETISLFRKDFTEAVKDKVMLMISQKLQRFDITLDPPELGNMQVKVNLQGEQAVVNFIVQNQQTKDALEQNMHKLRESLAEQGVDVGDANVEQQSQQSANEEGNGTRNTNQSEIESISEVNDVISHTLSAQVIDSATATVDYYA